MKLVVLILAAFLFQDIPYKEKDQFDLKMDMQFKNRPTNHTNAYPTQEKTSNNTPLPYIILNLTVLKILEDESKVRVVDETSNTLQTVNLTRRTNVVLDLGFAADIKDNISPQKYSVNFYSAEKQLKRTILIHFEKDGTYYVNGEKRGRI
jgi:hypothetical protein